MGAPGRAMNSLSGSRSSSVRSVGTPRKGIVKDRRSASARALSDRSASVLSKVHGNRFQGSSNQQSDEELNADAQQTGAKYQQLNQVYIAPSPNAEIINQAAAAVVEAQQRESSMRTEAERVVLTTQAQAAQRESSLRSEAERVVLTTQAEAERALLTTQAQAAQRESSVRSEAERAVLTTQAQATEAVASMRLEFESREKGLLDEIYRLRSLVAGGIDIRDQMRPNGTDLNNKIDQLIQRMTSFESQMLERNDHL